MRKLIAISISALLIAFPAWAGLKTEDSITMKKIATPSSNPASGYMKLYFKSDSAIYSLDSSGSEAAAGGGGGGSGDVTAVGDCASGACLSGIAGGGTTFALYDGDSNKGTFVIANLDADRTYTFGNLALTFDQSVAVGAGPAFTNAVLTTPNIGSATGSISGNAGTATALAADPANCASSGLAGGINASGTAEGCVTPGTGVATALAVNVGSVGALVVNGGALGTPSSGVATNLTGTASGLTAGTVTTNANLTGEVTSSGNAATIADSVTVTGWVMGASTATTPSADDNDTSLATTAFVQTEFAYREFDLFPAGMILDDGSPPDLTVVESTGTGTPRRLVADFDPTTDQFGYWTFTAPSDTTNGNILIYVLWFTNDTGANEDAIWYAQLSCTTEGDADSMAEDAVGTANTASENCNATEANRLISTTITLSNTDSIAPGDVCTLVFGRDADDTIGDADNDGLTSDARLVSVHVKIPRI